MSKFNIVLTIALCLFCSPIFAGSLEPVASPSSTMKTLADIEPRTAIPVPASYPININKSGSYYLTGNLSVSTTASAIYIADSNVTLDLNGFTIDGKNNGQYGIRTLSNYKNIKICNGTLTNYQYYGIYMPNASECIFENLTVKNITNGTGYGLQAGKASVIDNCVATDCLGYGIYADGNSVIRNSKCSKTMFGIGALNSLISNCISSGNSYYGFMCNGTTFQNCVANNNTQTGFSIKYSSCYNCSAAYNSTGFFADGNSLVVNCTARSNTLGGIMLLGCSIARNNTCSGSTSSTSSAGIAVNITSGNLCVVEGNTCFNNSRGIYDYGNISIIIKNVCYNNPSGNYTGTSTRLAPIINSNTALQGTANPLCNFGY